MGIRFQRVSAIPRRVYNEADETYALVDRRRLKYVESRLQTDSRIKSVKYQWDSEAKKIAFGIHLKPTSLEPRSTVLVVRFLPERFFPGADPEKIIESIDQAITLRDTGDIPELAMEEDNATA
jgi:hypothetical protein